MEHSEQVSEYTRIRQVLEKYIEGSKKAESKVMRNSFHPMAHVLFSGPDGELMGGAVDDVLFRPLDTDYEASPEAVSEITRIEIVGSAASVRIETRDLFGMGFTDFMHLLKVDGKWQIVNKVFQIHG